MGVDRDVLFRAALKNAGLPQPEAEYIFAKPRRWRFDYSWEFKALATHEGRTKVALEVEGGVFVKGRHSRGAGMVKDMEKYNEAALRGWKVLRVTPSQLCTKATMDLIRRALA